MKQCFSCIINLSKNLINNMYTTINRRHGADELSEYLAKGESGII